MTAAQLRREVARLRAWAEAIEAARHASVVAVLPKPSPEQVRAILKVLAKSGAFAGRDPTPLAVHYMGEVLGMTGADIKRFYEEHPNRREKDNGPEQPTDRSGSGGELPTGT